MNTYFKLIVAGLVSAFFMTGTIAQAADTCAPETQESRLQQGIQDNPELLVGVYEGDQLNEMFQRMEYLKMLLGDIGVDKIYIFYSENHPTWVYVFFLNKGCIIDVRLTYKNLMEYFITGDDSFIKPPRTN